MHADYTNPATRISWKTLASVCKVKYGPHLDEEACIQIADKAFFTLSSQLDCRYFIGLTLCGSEMWVLQFTRGGSAVSNLIDIHDHPKEFMYILTIFALGCLPWLGYDKHIFAAPDDYLVVKFAGDMYKIIQPLFMSSSIQG